MSVWDVITHPIPEAPGLVRWLVAATCFFAGVGIAFARRNRYEESE
jgi:hypothetical protein